MVLRPRILLVAILVVLALVVGAALLFRNGGERLVARQSSAASAQALRDCLGTRLGLTWQGDPRAMHASTFGLRVVVSDSGKSRQIGFFTAGARKLNSSESAALQECATTK